MSDLSRRETLRITAGLTCAAASQARASDPPNIAVEGRARDSKAAGRLVSMRDFERLAPGSMTREAWEFISSGAGDEHTVRWNDTRRDSPEAETGHQSEIE